MMEFALVLDVLELLLHDVGVLVPDCLVDLSEFGGFADGRDRPVDVLLVGVVAADGSLG